jgi:hypothetical protein
MAAVVETITREILLQDKAQSWIQRAQSCAVNDQVSYEHASHELLGIKSLLAEADETFNPIISKAYDAHKEALTQKKRVTDPLMQAETILKRGIGAYLAAERKRVEDEQRVLREQREREAAEQREREIEEAEAMAAPIEEVRAIIERPLRVAPVIVTTQAPRVSGISASETWKAEVTDLLALVKYAAAHPNFVGLLAPNTTAIGAMARSLKSTMNIPGVKIWSETGVRAGRR